MIFPRIYVPFAGLVVKQCIYLCLTSSNPPIISSRKNKTIEYKYIST